MSSLISVEHLRKVFPHKRGDVVAVEDVSFELQSGEILGVLGPNGAGKTTTIQMLLGTLAPSAGSIRYFGRDFARDRSAILQQVAFASSFTKLPWRLTVLENLDVYGRIYGLSKLQRRTRIEELLRRFAVWESREKAVAALSAGQLTRVLLAKAFLARPKIALLDEPTAALDPEIAQEVRIFLKRQRNEEGVSMIYTSHNMDEVAEVCDRVVFLKHGRIVASDTPQNLAHQLALTALHLHKPTPREMLENLLLSKKLSYELSNGSCMIHIADDAVAPFLSEIAIAGIRFENLLIERPTLEEFFLRVAKGGG